MNRSASAADVQGVEGFLAGRLEFRSEAAYVPARDSDFFYLKINHGYWEQLFALFCTLESASPRISDPTVYRAQYVDSWFLEALDAQVIDAVADDHHVGGHVARFPGVHFGVSLSNGDCEHRDVVSSLHSEGALLRQVVRGAAIGLTAYFESLVGPKRLSVCEGSFAKLGFKTGVLRNCMCTFAEASDRVIFVVPPHLRGIRIVGMNVPHEHLFVSGSMVHESWLAALYVTVGRILQRLASGERVMVVTQSAVFAALLGLFLKSAKKAVVPEATVSFFDLGQCWTSRHHRRAGHGCGSTPFGVSRCLCRARANRRRCSGNGRDKRGFTAGRCCTFQGD